VDVNCPQRIPVKIDIDDVSDAVATRDAELRAENAGFETNSLAKDDHDRLARKPMSL